MLPRAEGEALAAAAPDPFVAALRAAGPWGRELSRGVDRGDPAPRATRGAHVARRRLPARSRRSSREAEPLRDLGGRDLWDLCDVLAIRAAMLRELS